MLVRQVENSPRWPHPWLRLLASAQLHTTQVHELLRRTLENHWRLWSCRITHSSVKLLIDCFRFYFVHKKCTVSRHCNGQIGRPRCGELGNVSFWADYLHSVVDMQLISGRCDDVIQGMGDTYFCLLYASDRLSNHFSVHASACGQIGCLTITIRIPQFVADFHQILYAAPNAFIVLTGRWNRKYEKRHLLIIFCLTQSKWTD